jgi:hypothetical protein
MTISGFLSQKIKMENNNLQCEKKELCSGFNHKKRNEGMKKTTLVVNLKSFHPKKINRGGHQVVLVGPRLAQSNFG